MYIDIIKECEGAKRIGISGHVRPDGDCIGSVISTYLYLNKCLKDVTIKAFLENPDPTFKELAGFDELITDAPEEEPFDVFFVLDCSPDRMGSAVKYAESAKKTINVDHHITNKLECTVNCVEPKIGSCCEVLYDLFAADKLDADIAKALYIGIIHDTGVFQFSNTTPETLKKGAELIKYGFDFTRIIQETFYQKTYVQAQIMGRALMESVRFMDNRCIVSVIEKKTMDFYGATSNDLSGIVNHLLNIEGISCAIFMYQTDVLEYKVSLRTDEKVDATAVVSHFGGGGHMRAAGCTMKGTYHDCINNLSLYIEEQLEKA